MPQNVDVWAGVGLAAHTAEARDTASIERPEMIEVRPGRFDGAGYCVIVVGHFPERGGYLIDVYQARPVRILTSRWVAEPPQTAQAALAWARSACQGL